MVILVQKENSARSENFWFVLVEQTHRKASNKDAIVVTQTNFCQYFAAQCDCFAKQQNSADVTTAASFRTFPRRSSAGSASSCAAAERYRLRWLVRSFHTARVVHCVFSQCSEHCGETNATRGAAGVKQATQQTSIPIHRTGFQQIC